jgi:hypothetical protein
MKRSLFLIVSILLLVMPMPGCSRLQWGFPRIALEVPSPDGRFIAYVRNHPSLDPFEQSLWVETKDGRSVQVALVPPDAWWCNQIAWSGDSRRVAFVVANAVVQVYEAPSGAKVFSGFVGRRSWDTPPRYVLRDVSLSKDGASIAFRECDRTWVRRDSEGVGDRGGFMPVIGGCRTTPDTVAFAQVPAEKHWP